MAWPGYFQFNGEEICNAVRTERYARAAGVSWFRPAYDNNDLPAILSEHYNSPMQDDAPWTDPDDLDTFDFFGAYPLDVTGIEDATTSATVTESTLDGGLVGRARRGTKAIVFNMVLVGMSECAVEAGFRWLKSAVTSGPCSGAAEASCVGNDLCYFSCEPCVDWATCDGDPTVCFARYFRSLHKVAVINGPNITGKRIMVDGGCAWMVSMTMVAGNPYEYSAENRLIRGFMNPKVDNPYVEGVLTPTGDIPSFDDAGYVETDADCPVRAFIPLEDPLCPQTILPPAVPQADSVQLSCFNFPVNYKRRTFSIPENFVPMWTDVVPVIEIHAKKEVRTLRLRFYADVLGAGDPSADPCAFCGDIVFSYIPPGSTLVFDGTDEVVYLERGGGRRQRADTVVFGSDGGPFEWPQLTCGYSYIVALDMPQTQSPPTVDLSLYARVG
jgi:hypothetical protein